MSMAIFGLWLWAVAYPSADFGPAVAAEPDQAPSTSLASPDLTARPRDLDEKGVVWTTLRRGTGSRLTLPTDVVTVEYTAWTASGELLGSSSPGGVPATWAIDQNPLPGLRQALTGMLEGEKRRIWMNQTYAFRHQPGRMVGELIFEVELRSIAAPLVMVPDDLKRPPDDALRTASGIAYRVLRRGNGTRHPTADSEVTVHYSGWSVDGTLFDSSVLRDEPAVVRLDTAMPGWREGLQLMVEGDHARFWIPQKLALNGVPPLGAAVVFEIELIAIR
jgi:FKBP-type peptidyl-prolyl cis-trans isomerase